MTSKAISEILALIDVYYPEQPRRTSADRARQLKAWGYVLADISDDSGRAAAMIWFKHNRYPPHVSDIVAGVESMTDAATDTGIEKYWAESWRAVCGDLKFNDLSDVSRAYWRNQRAIDAAGQSEKTIESVLKGQFMRVAPDIIKRIKTEKETPPDLARSLAGDQSIQVDARRENLLKLETAIRKDADELPEQTDAEKKERRARWLSVIDGNNTG